MDLHAVADRWEEASLWRTGARRISSWSVRDVATGVSVAAVRLVRGGRYSLETACGARSVHDALAGALAAASEAMTPRGLVS